MKQSCDILYVHSTKNPTSAGNLAYSIMPMGIIGILNNLKGKGYNILGINCAIEMFLNPEYDVAIELENIEYKILLTDLHWYEHSFGALYIAKCSKSMYPEVPVVLGGYTSTIYAEEIITQFSCVDYIVTGDSDLPMTLLVDFLLGKDNQSEENIPNLFYRQENKVAKSKEVWVQEEMDSIDFVDVSMFKNRKYIPYLTTSGVRKITPHFWLCIARGCKYNCSYCCGAHSNMKKLFGRCNVLLRSPQRIAEDFIKLTKAGIVRVCPSHDFQMFGESFYKTLFSEIRKHNVKPGMYLECFQLPSKEYIDEIIKTFDRDQIVLVISPISGNEVLRKENGKVFSNKDFIEILKYIKYNNIKLQLYYTINVVGETKSQFEETIEQIKYIHNVLGLAKKCIFYQHIVVDPLAGIREVNGTQVKYKSFLDYYNYCLLPEGDFKTSGFNDMAELSMEEKRSVFESI